MTEKKSFLMYTSYLDNVAFLSDEEAGQLLKAIYAFVNGDEVPELERVVQVTFNPIKSHLERDMEKYKDICRKRSENIQKRWEKRKNTNEYNCIQTDSNYTDNDNENENVNVNDNVNENGNDNVNENDNEIIKFGTTIEMTGQQYRQLCGKYGKDETDRYIRMVDKYIPICTARVIESPYEELVSWLERSRKRLIDLGQEL